MTTRILPQAEWFRLAETEIGPALSALPADTHMIAVEDEAGAIVGAWAVIRYIHVEGIWIAPAHRKRGRVLARLLSGMRTVARSLGVQAVWKAALTEDVRMLITNYGGQQLPGDHFVFPIEGRSCRP